MVECILKDLRGKLWAGLNWLRMRYISGCCTRGKELLGFVKREKNYMAEGNFVLQEAMCCTELLNLIDQSILQLIWQHCLPELQKATLSVSKSEGNGRLLTVTCEHLPERLR